MASGVELATAWIQLVPTMKGVNGEVAKALGPVDGEAETAGKKAGGKFTTGFKVGMTLLAGAVVGTVGKALTGSVKQAIDLNEAGTAVGEIFGSSFSSIDKWAAAAAGNLGQSHLEALNAAKSFGVYGQAAGLSQEENAKFSVGLAELATDFASFHNVPVAEAIEAIGAGLRGEAEPLRKFGVLLDDASLRAKAMEMGIYDGNGSLTAQQKIMASNELIYAGAGAAVGDFGRTSGETAGQQKILGAELANLSATVGTALIPALDAMLAIAQPIMKWMSEHPAVVQVLAITLGILAVAILAVVAAMWLMALNPVGIAIGLIVIAVGLLVAAIVALVMHWDKVVAFLKTIWAGFVSWITSVTAGFVAWWNGMWSSFGAWISNTWNTFTTWVKGVWAGFISWVIGIVSGFVGWWNGVWTAVGSFIRAAWSAFTAAVTAIWNGYISWIRGVVAGLVGWWNGVWSSFGNGIRAAWSALVSAITGIWNGFMGWIRGVVAGLVGWWNGTWSGFGNGIRSVWSSMVSAITGIWNGFMGWLRGAVSGLVGWWNGVWGTIGNAVRSAFSGIAGFVSGVWSGIVSTIQGAVSRILGTVNGMIGGLNNLLGVVNKVAGTSFNIPKIPGLATGGTIRRAGTVLVGENGPELLNLPRGASVDPNIENVGRKGNVIFQNYAPLGRTPAQALSEFANRAGGIL